MFKQKPCSECGSKWHSAWHHKKKKPLKKISDRTRTKEELAKEKWFEANPPDDAGLWTCYLQISPHCPILLNRQTVVQEHVISKTHAQELSYDITNRRPACDPCNELKAGRWLEEIPEYVAKHPEDSAYRKQGELRSRYYPD